MSWKPEFNFIFLLDYIIKALSDLPDFATVKMRRIKMKRIKSLGGCCPKYDCSCPKYDYICPKYDGNFIQNMAVLGKPSRKKICLRLDFF